MQTYLASRSFTVIGTGAGVVAFHFIRQRASQPARTFLIVAVAALAGSYAPNLFLMFAGSQDMFPGLTDSAVVALMFMHLAAAVITCGDSGVVGAPRQQMICRDAERRIRMHQAEV